ncbi:MAG: nucleoside-diphosphate kinase [Bacillota bacterium]|nr:nucleoside-diphosphate kinase [Bacillota bacterium]
MERTFVIVKPDGVERGLVGAVIERFERRGFRIVKMDMRTIARSDAARHYEHLADRPIFQGLLDYVTRGPSALLVFERDADAVRVARSLIGATNPADALPGTIRGDFGGTLPENVVHASDSPESYEREVRIFFPEEAGSLTSIDR